MRAARFILAATFALGPRAGAQRIVVGPDRAVLTPGLTQHMLVVVQDVRGEPVEGAKVAWTSSNPEVASASEGGIVTAKKAGVARITATARGLKSVVTLSVRDTPAVVSKAFVTHQNVTATVFWVGEGADASNEYISNAASAFDEHWLVHYGGVDAPSPRREYSPASFRPKENPFYVALPYTDLDEQGDRKRNATLVVPWAGSSRRGTGSIVKNRWIAVTSRRSARTCYGQWEDAGPGVYDDFQYVFGNAPPANPFTLGDGRRSSAIDLSPAMRDCLEQGADILTVDWRFIEEAAVPGGPWREVVTRR